VVILLTSLLVTRLVAYQTCTLTHNLSSLDTRYGSHNDVVVDGDVVVVVDDDEDDDEDGMRWSLCPGRRVVDVWTSLVVNFPLLSSPLVYLVWREVGYLD